MAWHQGLAVLRSFELTAALDLFANPDWLIIPFCGKCIDGRTTAGFGPQLAAPRRLRHDWGNAHKSPRK
jgi:hypothetical protein